MDQITQGKGKGKGKGGKGLVDAFDHELALALACDNKEHVAKMFRYVLLMIGTDEEGLP